MDSAKIQSKIYRLAQPCFEPESEDYHATWLVLKVCMQCAINGEMHYLNKAISKNTSAR